MYHIFLLSSQSHSLEIVPVYNRWIHQRFCQSKEIRHNFWWQDSTRLHYCCYLRVNHCRFLIKESSSKHDLFSYLKKNKYLVLVYLWFQSDGRPGSLAMRHDPENPELSSRTYGHFYLGQCHKTNVVTGGMCQFFIAKCMVMPCPCISSKHSEKTLLSGQFSQKQLKLELVKI